MSDLSDEAIRAYAANIFALEDAREVTQSDLKDAWAHIREAHGKRFADSLKLAVKRARQDADKRAAADEVDAEAERIMAILSAPRAITDLTQPNPICRDPGDCGVYASWHHPCLACTRAWERVRRSSMTLTLL